MFKGKEKKQIAEEINRLNSQKPSYEDIKAQRKAMRDQMQPQIDTVQQEATKLQATISEFSKKINEIRTELEKDR